MFVTNKAVICTNIYCPLKKMCARSIIHKHHQAVPEEMRLFMMTSLYANGVCDNFLHITLVKRNNGDGKPTDFPGEKFRELDTRDISHSKN